MLISSVALLIFASFLLINLFSLQILGYGYYTEKVTNQITTTSALRAERGNIYDSEMNLLAATNTVWRIFISTKDIKKAEKESGTKYSNLISDGLSRILGMTSQTIYNKIIGTNQLDVTIQKAATKDEYTKALEFIRKNKLEKLVFTEAQSSRYYPEGTLAAHVLGFTGSDNQGLYGIEYYYESVLKGKDGYYLYSKDANGNALDTEYSDYVLPTNGYSLVTTIDPYIQRELEGQLESIVLNHSVENRATGIVMNTATGAILAMATTAPFDPNDPYALSDFYNKKLYSSGYIEGSDEFTRYKKELLAEMWSNKAVSEAYEPGSTFKIVTVATALSTNAAKLDDTFSCAGFYTVGGWHIKCHKVTGHGSGFTLAYGLQMSCNPTMMQIAERIGSDRFYEYVEKFGYFEKSGIDLPSEASTIFHEKESIGKTELATISFGQRFKVTVINHLTAIAAIANGGELVTPYIVDKIIDSNGNIISEHETKSRGRVVSEDIASAVADVLEKGVSGEGGAKNAYVDGYKVAAKTGTSQKFDILDENGNSYLRISSTVAFAPSDESGIAVIIVVDEPTSQVKYGSVVAAPYVSKLLSSVLPYLEYESTAEKINQPVPDCVGLSITEAVKKLKSEGFDYEIVGSEETVLRQTPRANDIITSRGSKIILYTSDEDELVSVPSLIGMELSSAVEAAIESGLNVVICGGSGGYVVSQSLPLNARVERGYTITLEISENDFED